jgi:hypothetical protein
MSGNTSAVGDVGKSPGKSFLFFLTVGKTMESDCPEIWFFHWQSDAFLYRPVRF